MCENSHHRKTSTLTPTPTRRPRSHHSYTLICEEPVYVRYSPTVAGERRRASAIRSNLPRGGEVRILYVTDREWSHALGFRNEEPVEAEPEPQQLMIF